MVKNNLTKAIDIRIKDKVLELQSKGYSRKQIKEVTGISRSSQQRISKKNSFGISLESKTPNRKMWNNGNSKYTEEYCERLKMLVKEKNDLSINEYIQEMEEKTKIKLSERSMYRLMKNLNITTKKKQLFMRIHFFQ